MAFAWITLARGFMPEKSLLTDKDKIRIVEVILSLAQKPNELGCHLMQNNYFKIPLEEKAMSELLSQTGNIR